MTQETRDEEIVHVVDDDVDVRDSIRMLLWSADFRVETSSTPQELLAKVDSGNRGCLVLDVRLPGMNGLELQKTLQERGIDMPIVFITGHGDIPLAVEAVNAGALDFLEKPFEDEVLIERIRNGLELNRQREDARSRRASVESRLETLTPREREVMEGILQGKLNKVIAHELDVSVRTVEVHRARVLEKMEARNSSDMVRLVLSTEEYRDWLI